MAKLLKLRRGTTSQHNTFTGAEGEVTIDTTKDTAVVHDGAQAGGRPLAREDMSNVSSSSIAGRLGADSIAVTKIAGGTLPSDVKVNSANITDGSIVNSDVNGSAAIAGTKIAPDFGSQNITTTGTANFGNNIEVNGTSPFINIVDSDNNSDYKIHNDNGSLKVRDMSNSNATRLQIHGDGTVDVYGNLDANSGLDVTGNMTVTGTVDGVDVAGLHSAVSGLSTGSGILHSSVSIANGVTAHTQAQSDNSTKVATTAYVKSAVANVVDSAPGTLDTLNELAAALGDDANFATTTANSIGTKLPKSGGQMTGNITMSGSQTVDGRDLSVDGAKLDGIESGATADQSASEILTLIKTVDGSGSGLDADTLDGVSSGSFLRSDASDSATQPITFSGGGGAISVGANSDIRLTSGSWTGEHAGKIQHHGNHLYFQNGGGNWTFRNQSGSEKLIIDSSGNLTADGNVTAYSDVRLKTDIHTINDALGICGKLRGVSYKWLKNNKDGIGVIAQEVEEVLPEVVLTNVNTDTETGITTDIKSVDYGKIVGVLIYAINELKAEVDELKGGK